MIDIFYCEIKRESGWQLEDFLKQLPDELKKQVLSFKFQHNQYENALGKILLFKALIKYGYDTDCLKQIKYNEYSRPYIDNKVDFNISHSDKIVICGISSVQKIGVDIEKIRNIDFNDFSNMLNFSQWQKVYHSVNPIKTFFQYWTQKESVVKAIGMGLSLPFEDIIIKNNIVQLNQELYYVKELELRQDYIAQLASNKAINQIRYHEVSF